MYKPIMWAVLVLSVVSVSAAGQNNLTAKANSVVTKSESAVVESDRIRDGYAGPVRRVRTEVAKLSAVSGKLEEGKRVLLETAEYDLGGSKTQNQYFPVTGTSLTGREVYKYDDKGNISEMTLINTDGSLLSKEVYRYEFDSIGNWVKMTTSVATVENGKLAFEPAEITYRTIFYYLDASMAKMLQPSSDSSNGPAKADPPKTSNANSVAENKMVALPPRTSLDKLKLGTVQPLAGDVAAAIVNTNKLEVPVDSEQPPAPRTILKPMSGGVLNGKALNLPTPIYPERARLMRTSGKVEVEVVIDENGKVISAQVTSGPTLLREAAVQAASRARFSPTKLSGQPVKVVGKIFYNFVAQ